METGRREPQKSRAPQCGADTVISTPRPAWAVRGGHHFHIQATTCCRLRESISETAPMM